MGGTLKDQRSFGVQLVAGSLPPSLLLKLSPATATAKPTARGPAPAVAFYRDPFAA